MIAAPMIEIQAVSKRYGKGPAVLETIDLYVSKEEFVTLIGPSGCGKSTVLKLISGLTAPSGGTLRVDGMTAANARGIVSYISRTLRCCHGVRSGKMSGSVWNWRVHRRSGARNARMRCWNWSGCGRLRTLTRANSQEA
jgi:ABC-type cobalamin/Fe3+-siderophores transport system ATPase subunit